MVFLTRFPAKNVVLMAVGLALSTITICYLVATSLGHVPYWLPDITHCARYAPERFIFRAGLIPACILLAYVWYLATCWLEDEQTRVKGAPGGSATIIRSLGVVGSLALVVSSSVLESDHTTMWTLHVICASSFFLLTYVAQVLMTRELYKLRKKNKQVLSSGSMRAKLGVCGSITLILLADAVIAIAKLPSTYSNLCEWTMTFLIILYNVSYCYDFAGRMYSAAYFVPQSAADTYSALPSPAPTPHSSFSAPPSAPLPYGGAHVQLAAPQQVYTHPPAAPFFPGPQQWATPPPYCAPRSSHPQFH